MNCHDLPPQPHQPIPLWVRQWLTLPPGDPRVEMYRWLVAAWRGSGPEGLDPEQLTSSLGDHGELRPAPRNPEWYGSDDSARWIPGSGWGT